MMRTRHVCWSFCRALVMIAFALVLVSVTGCDKKVTVSKMPTPARVVEALKPFLHWGKSDPPVPRFPVKVSSTPDKPRLPRHAPAPVLKRVPLAQTNARSLSSVSPMGPQAHMGRREQATLAYFGKGRGFRLLIEMDKPLYQPGESVWIRAVAIKQKRNQLSALTARTTFRILSPRGSVLQTGHAPSYRGHSRFRFALPRGSVGGQYKIEATHTMSVQKGRYHAFKHVAKATKSFFVSVYQPPRVKKTLTFIRKGYDGGEQVQATLSIKSATNVPLAGKRLPVVVRLGGKVIKTLRVTTAQDGKALISFRLPKRLRASEGTLTIRVPTGGATESISRPIPLRARAMKVGLFPEGGVSVLGQPSRVYVACRRRDDGTPQDFEGVIKDAKGTVVARVQSFHDGMGRFVYTPVPKGRYSLHIVRPAGITKSTPLPRAVKQGVALQMVDDFRATKPSLQLMLHSSAKRDVVVLAMQHETLLAQETFRLEQGGQRMVLPLKHQWRGIVRVSVLDPTSHQTLAERLVFRHRGKGLQIKIRTDRWLYQPRRTVRAKIKVLAPDGRPLKGARIGVSVVDDTVLRYADDHSADWLAQRYLTRQLKGSIHKPNFYFSKREQKAPRALDLVMGTHGWRTYVSWKVMQKGTPAPVLAAWHRSPPKAFDKSTLIASKWIGRDAEKQADTGKSEDKNKRKGLVGTKPGAPDPFVPSRKWKKKPAKMAPRSSSSSPRRKTWSNSSILGLLGGKTAGGVDVGLGKGLGLKGRGFGMGGGGGAGVGGLYGRGGMSLRGKRVYGRGSGWGYGGRTRRTVRRRRVRMRGGAGRSAGGGGVVLDFLGRSLGGLRSRRAPRWRRRVRRRSVSVRMGPVVVSGSSRRVVIARILRRYRYMYRYCYEKELRISPRMRLRFSLRVVVNSSGRVVTASVSRSRGAGTRRKHVERCVVRRFLRMRFPRPTAGIVIFRVPFRFSNTRRYGLRLASRWARRAYRPRYSAHWTYAPSFPVRFYAATKQEGQPRKDFRETLYWHPHLVTNVWGEAEVSFGLNDSIGSFRLRVSGVGGGWLGQRSRVIKSVRSFYVTAKIPMEVSEGDAMVLPVTLTNYSRKAVEAKVKVQLSPSFKLQEHPLPGVARLPSGQQKTYFFPIRVLAKSGTGRVSLTVTAPGFRDVLKRKISIAPRGFPRVVSWSKLLRPNQRHKHVFRLPPTYSGLDGQWMLDVTPVSRMDRSLMGLLREPHGCFEQASSTNFPNIMLLQYLKQKKVQAPRLYRKAYSMIQRGYKKLIRYETPTGGFSLFGRSPGNPAITAYGLLQFHQMKRVYGGVDPAMLKRVTAWLLRQRDGRGGFASLRYGGGKFGRASASIASLYIGYVLTELGTSGIAKERSALLRRVASSGDAYQLALGVLMAAKSLGRGNARTRALLGLLVALQKADGGFVGTMGSITLSSGRNLRIETTALAALGMLRAGAKKARVMRAIRWIQRQRSAFGRYGTTQATVLSLQAMNQAERRYPTRVKETSLTLRANARSHTVRFKKGKAKRGKTGGSIRTWLKPGSNRLVFALNGSHAMPFSFGYAYYTRVPLSNAGTKVKLTTKLSKQKVRMGELVRLTATLTNRTGRRLPTPMVKLSFPGGFALQSWQIKQWKARRVADFIETKPRQVILYWKSLAPRAKKVLTLDLVARVTGNYTGGASSAYLYYDDHRKFWTQPLLVSIVP